MQMGVGKGPEKNGKGRFGPMAFFIRVMPLTEMAQKVPLSARFSCKCLFESSLVRLDLCRARSEG
jgi:hypothetical protein